MNPTNSTRSLWPAALFATLTLFAFGIATLVTLSIRSDEDLVSEDYYEHEVRFQNQIDRQQRTAAYLEQLGVQYDAAQANLELRIPAEHASKHATGMVKLYRPSDARLDRELPLNVNAAGIQDVSTAQLASGLWKLRINWQVDGQEFYSEKPIVVKNSRS